jgi:hypothetical protein
LGLFGVSGGTIVVADDVAGTDYAKMAGEPVRTPKKPHLRPDPTSLDWHLAHIFRGSPK